MSSNIELSLAEKFRIGLVTVSIVLSAFAMRSASARTNTCERQLQFAEHAIVPYIAAHANSVVAADLDGDGDNDVLGAWEDRTIAWYENLDGAGNFGRQQVISTVGRRHRSVSAADLDGDGDVDVLTASFTDGRVSWFQNLDGAGTFGPRNVITNLANGTSSVGIADVDGDGDADVLSASWYDDKVAWYENVDGAGSFGPQQVITTLAEGASSVFAVDLDGDADVDVLSASIHDDKIAWYENLDGAGRFGPQQVISILANGAWSVFAGDLDLDGDTDVLSASTHDNKIAWYENLDGQGTFGPQQVIATVAYEARSVFAADLDDDGDEDVLSASQGDDKIAWYENLDGQGTFGPQQVISTMADGARSVFAADLNADGETDVVSASYTDDKIAWYQNLDGRGAFGSQQIIVASVANGVNSVFATDLDGDGDHDALSASSIDHKIAWYMNEDGAGRFGPQQVISTMAHGATSVFAIDLDGDGDQDVLSASFQDDKIAWYENLDGAGTFGIQRVVTTLAVGPTSVFAVDLDGDRDADILSASTVDDTIAWYENLAEGKFGAQQIISDLADQARSVIAADVDGDGDQDVLSASIGDGKIAWYENLNGIGSFGPQRVITTQAILAWSVFASDLDGDGDQDILSAALNEVAWYENLDGAGNFGAQRVVTTVGSPFRSVSVADVDGDGDADVFSSGLRLAWYENLNGHGGFGSERFIDLASAQSIVAVDLDGDSGPDVISASPSIDKIAWYENRPGSVDLDADGQVGPTDVAALLGCWGPCPCIVGGCFADFDANASVTASDLLMLIEAWGPCASE